MFISIHTYIYIYTYISNTDDRTFCQSGELCNRRGAWNMMDMVLVVAYAARGCIRD